MGSHHEDFLIQQYTDLLGNFDFYTDSYEAKSSVESVVNGQEVEDWECGEGCPCLDLDQQSGVTRSAVAKEVKVSQVQGQFVANATTRPGINQHADEGGASRYFKQVQTDTDLWEYLRTMISPPWPFGQAVVLEGWPEWLATAAKGSCTGFILYGHKPSAAEVAHLHSLLTPGGYICLVAPDSQPTGHTGAILLEDGGFEIRDAILWVRGPGKVHYVAKAARKEREAGCQKLPAKKGFEAVDRKEGSAGVKNPRAGAGRTANKVRNFHPTVKPIALMVRLLADVPKDEGPVLDPFLGSGTTVIACRQTGHSAIGIEREAEYLLIGETRVRHWDRAKQGWTGGAQIVSDLDPPKAEVPQEIELDDFWA